MRCEEQIKIRNNSIRQCNNCQCIVLSLCRVVLALIMWEAVIKLAQFILASMHIDFAVQLRVNLNFQLQSYTHNYIIKAISKQLIKLIKYVSQFYNLLLQNSR